MSKERKFVFKPKGGKGYGYDVIVDGIDLSDYVTELNIYFNGRDKVPRINVTMVFGPRELEIDVPAEIKLKIEELQASNQGSELPEPDLESIETRKHW